MKDSGHVKADIFCLCSGIELPIKLHVTSTRGSQTTKPC